MGYRLSKIYTKTGDDGYTGLANGTRVPKDSALIQAIGDLDELNSTIGILVSAIPNSSIAPILTEIQHNLFEIGGELSMPDRQTFNSRHVEKLETVLDQYNDDLSPLKEFILPGGSEAAAICHLARSICRRTERSIVALNNAQSINKSTQQFINRLSDLLFVLARVINRDQGYDDVYWRSKRIESKNA